MMSMQQVRESVPLKKEDPNPIFRPSFLFALRFSVKTPFSILA